LVEVELFLIEVELFLIEVELFLIEVELFLVEVLYLNNLHCCDICYYTKHYF
jgi:hypothetical protein